MPLVNNVSIKDATHVLAGHLNGNLEHNHLDLTAAAAIATLFKNGAHYTATDGHSIWKVVFTGFDHQYLHFQVAE